MKKILIISYYFPPCNLTASARIESWAKYLHEYGYYPIVITRNWDIQISSPKDVTKSSGSELKIDKFETHEVHYLPYQASLKDKLFTRFAGTNLQWISKPFTFFELIMENYTVKFIPYKNLYDHAQSILAADDSIRTLIISGNPFNQFSFGYHLKKKFPIEWIADYRDDWNTSELILKNNFSFGFIKRLQQRSEKKWVGSAKMITSVSSHYTKKISKYVSLPGEILMNGYDFEALDPSIQPPSGVFRITFNGSLYDSQPIELFISAIKEVIRTDKSDLKIEIHFPGLLFDKSQQKRVESLIVGFEHYFFLSKRLSRNNVIRLQQSSDLLLMITHSGLIGVPSSKLFEYIGLNRAILVLPGDNDIVEQIVSQTKSGYIAREEDQTITTLKNLISMKQEGKSPISSRDEKLVRTFSRKHQTKRLAEILDDFT